MDYLWSINQKMNIQQNFSLKHLNTFQVDCNASYYAEIDSIIDLQELIQSRIFKSKKFFILGGGSNVLFTKDFNGFIVHPNFRGIQIEEKNKDSVVLKIGAAENWVDLVDFTVKKGWWGIENLAGIPGNVGAAPVQNIGAYGVELKDIFVSLTAIDLGNGTEKVFQNEDCNFAYRNSVFKSEFKNKYLIKSVNLRLSKAAKPNTSYEALQAFFQQKKLLPSLKNTFDAIIEIRASRLPDPKELGNVGSFFKNPIVNKQQLTQLVSSHPELKSFTQSDGSIKLAAAWLIESCGWKGKRIGEVGIHEKQALVIVNYGEAKGKDIHSLAKQVMRSVKDKFGIKLEPEVNIL